VAARLSARRPEAVLLVLLSGCLVGLSVQVRRPGGITAGERWLLDLASPFVALAAKAREGVRSVAEWASTRHRLLVENRDLHARNDALEAEVVRLREAERDKSRLLEMFGVAPWIAPAARPARLVALQASGHFRSALLDRGLEDGIEAGGAVLSPSGLIGRVVATSAHAARVQLLSDATAAVGIVLTRSGRAAVAHGDGGGVTILYVPRSADVKPNVALVTAGTDGVYPKDLAVGKIAEVQRDSPGLFLGLPVALASDPHQESLVFVLPPVPVAPPMAEPTPRPEKTPPPVVK
jgi:rod shape-determining protein MreC